jgi:hypothetical protein
VTYQVTDGTHRGRKLFGQFNIKNANPQAVQIGLGQLKTMMEAGRKSNPNRLESSQELVGLRFRVKTKARVDDFGEKAEVKQWLPSEAAGGPVPAAQTQTSQAGSQPPHANPFG